MKTVAVGMSGGVDSTVAAHILKKQGYNVVGLTMSIQDGAVEDIELARNSAEKLGIKHFVIDLKKEYKSLVLDYFCGEYISGKTPNPCAVCNPKIKFGALIGKARAQGIEFDFFATGHYVRKEYDELNKRFILKKALELKRDQSYFLWGLEQKKLAEILFPLGGMFKKDARTIAREIGLPQIAEKADSQDFSCAGDYLRLFSEKDIKPGNIYSADGKTIGRHKGLIYYTLGQRKGMGIGGSGEPLYVVKIDAKTNSMTAGTKDMLYSDKFTAHSINWVSIEPPKKPVRLEVKIRQQSEQARAEIFPLGENTAEVKFDRPQLSITAGQSAVFYDGDILAGGGIIQ
ncbi:MAG: tRNA 2-thiouridine(34) synthase MnmA [Elusimicrobia bacterium]|nr:tRNA 2-thiouridine(34) synthase MnmA [Elusimicrobiota bacterium]